MGERCYSLIDRIIGEIDKAIKVLAAPAVAARPSPEPSLAPSGLEGAEQRQSIRLMRVNHAGEVSAQALYQGQALTSRNPALAAALRVSAAEETDHLAWCERRLEELGGRTSRLNPLWYAGSFTIGAVAGAFGDRTSLGFITETEKQVESHLRNHLERLPPADLRSRGILEQMQRDEMAHGAKAQSLGGAELPLPLKRGMRLASRLMTHSAYWV